MVFDFLHKYFANTPKSKKRIHLDYASATPVHPTVLKAMLPFFSEHWANPSAIYGSAVYVRKVIEDARVLLARTLRVRPYGIIFTSGGTESNNLALFGYIEALHKKGRAYADMEIISTRIEHPSILEVLEVLKVRGVLVSYTALLDDGRIAEKSFSALLSPKTVMVTFSYVNSEIGVVQEVKRLTRRVRAYMQEYALQIVVHLDASQAPLWLSCEMDMLGIDMLTLDAGKCYGPKGAGVLALRRGVTVAQQLLGGGQERGLRSSTENGALIIGGVTALVRAQNEWKKRSEAILLLRDFMMSEIFKEMPETVLNGSREARVANNINISIPGIDTEFAVITLDAYGIAASTKSACGAASSQGSYVVQEITQDDDRARSTLRFTLGEETTKSDLIAAVHVLKSHVASMRAFNEQLKTAR